MDEICIMLPIPLRKWVPPFFSYHVAVTQPVVPNFAADSIRKIAAEDISSRFPIPCSHVSDALQVMLDPWNG